MARRQGIFDDLMSIGLKLPWKMGLAAAVVIFVSLHVVAIYTQTAVSAKTVGDIGAVAQRGLIHVLAQFFQYIIPAGRFGIFVFGTKDYTGSIFASPRDRDKASFNSKATDVEHVQGLRRRCGDDQ